MFLMASSKKGVSANQLHRTLGCTLKTAWFIEHRIREAMATGGLERFGGGGGAVEVDETFIGIKPGAKVRRGQGHKNIIAHDRRSRDRSSSERRRPGQVGRYDA